MTATVSFNDCAVMVAGRETTRAGVCTTLTRVVSARPSLRDTTRPTPAAPAGPRPPGPGGHQSRGRRDDAGIERLEGEARIHYRNVGAIVGDRREPDGVADRAE